MQKKNYREEKKRATKELLSTITDPSVIVMADWLKVGVSPNSQSVFRPVLITPAMWVLGRTEIALLLYGFDCKNSVI